MSDPRLNTYWRRFMTPADRFMDLCMPVTESGCYIWLGSCGGEGRYGQFKYLGVNERASRASWMIFVGPIPDGALVCHHCDVTQCVRPSHLFLGDGVDNAQDMIRKGRNKPMRGEASPASKLTLAQVLYIRSTPKSGSSLAKEMGVGAMQISRIRRGLRWSHVTPE